MISTRTACNTRRTNRLSPFLLAATFTSLLKLTPVSGDPSTSSNPPMENSPTPAPGAEIIPIEPGPTAPDTQRRPTELAQVETAMGRNMDREYSTYEAVTHPPETRPNGFAFYLEEQYASERMSGIILAVVVAPILATVTAVGATQLYLHGVRDNGGFCNHVVYDDVLDEYGTDCEGDRGEIAGIALISTIAGLAALGVLIPGTVKIGRYNKRLRRIRPLTADAYAPASRVRFSYAVGPGDIAFGFRF